MPSIPFRRIFTFDSWDSEDAGSGDEEDPSEFMTGLLTLSLNAMGPLDVIPGMDKNQDTCLGVAQHRDPDALPPHSVFGVASNLVHQLLLGLGGGHVVFAFKAGLLSSELLSEPLKRSILNITLVILTLPSFMHSTARFAYSEFTYPLH